MQLAQSQQAFVCDFVEGVNQIQRSVYKLYLASDSSYRGDQFFLFNQLVSFNHEVIHMWWNQDLNKSEEVLAFSFGEHTVTAKHAGVALTREGFQAMLVELKKSIAGQCYIFPIGPLKLKKCCSACHYSTALLLLLGIHSLSLPCSCCRSPHQRDSGVVSFPYCDGCSGVSVSVVLVERRSTGTFSGPS